MKCGQRKAIPAPAAPLAYYFFGAYYWDMGQVAWHQSRKTKSETFLAFLRHLSFSVYPNQQLILVLDNASYHTSRASWAALAAVEERIWVFWMPKYTPFLNPIERL